MKVLVTGAGGFIASNVAEWLVKNFECEIFGTYRNRKPSGRSFSCVCCDLYHEPEILEELEFDAVIHFASQLYGENIREFLDNTVQATRNLIDAAERKNVKKFIYISTISVCGETKGTISENSARINQNDYEITKWIGERLLEDANFEEKIVIRLPRVLGKGIDLTAPWLPKVSYSILQNEDVFYYNPELKYNALIHTDDLSGFIYHILSEKENLSGIYLLGSEDEITVLEILKILKSGFQSKSKLIEVEPRGANRCYSVDITKAKAAGFRADTVRNVLKKYIKDMEEEVNASM